MNEALRRIHMQVMWNRLISVVEEQAQTLVRTAFGPATREAGDLSAGVFLPGGEMVAQAVTGTPGHVNSMAESVRYFLHAFPAVDNAASNGLCRKVGFLYVAECDFEYPPGHIMHCNDWRLDLLGSG